MIKLFLLHLRTRIKRNWLAYYLTPKNIFSGSYLFTYPTNILTSPRMKTSLNIPFKKLTFFPNNRIILKPLYLLKMPEPKNFKANCWPSAVRLIRVEFKLYGDDKSWPLIVSSKNLCKSIWTDNFFNRWIQFSKRKQTYVLFKLRKTVSPPRFYTSVMYSWDLK